MSLKAGVAVASLTTVVLVGAGLATPPLTSVATVTMTEGEVRVRGASGRDVLAHEGLVLYARDQVTTGPSGFAVITYGDGSTVALEPGSAVTIEAVETGTAGRVLILMAQTAGRAWYSISTALSPSSRFEVRTPAAAAVVRAGSTVQVDVAAAGETGITTLSGNAAANAVGSAVDVPAGHSTVVRVGSTPAPAAPVAVAQVQPAVTAIPATPSPTPAPVLPKLALPSLPAAPQPVQLRQPSRDDDEDRFASREGDDDEDLSDRDDSDDSSDDDDSDSDD